MSCHKCVIFDRDGVLVDMASNLGADIDLSFAMRHFKGSHFKDCVKVISSLETNRSRII